jgi:hypothetical protein
MSSTVSIRVKHTFYGSVSTFWPTQMSRADSHDAGGVSFFLDGENADLPEAVGEGHLGRVIDNGVFFAIDKC